jgi:hypothetical protein
MNRIASFLAILISIAACALAALAFQQSGALPVGSAQAPSSDSSAARVQALERQVADLEASIAHVREQLAQPATAAAMADDQVKEVVRSELRDQMARFRQSFGGGNNGRSQQPEDPQATQRELIDTVGVDQAKAEKLTQLMDQNRTAIREIMRNGESWEQNATKVQAERDKLEAQAAEMLSAEEVVKYKAWQEKRQASRSQRWGRGGGGGDAPPEQPKGTSF